MARGRGQRGGRIPVGSTGSRSGCLAAQLALCAAALALVAAPAQAAGPPQIDATWVTDVAATSATLHATVNAEGLATNYRFEYVTEAAFQANLGEGKEGFFGAAKAPSFGEAALGSESIDRPVLQHVSSLRVNTTYRYRIVATNSAVAGGVKGDTHIFTTQPLGTGGVEECPNAQLRFENNSFALPDCRAWEMVSPVDKNGGAVQGFGDNSGGDVLQAAADGGSATYSSSASFGVGAQGAPTASQYISRRTDGGWIAENITGPTLSGAYPNDDPGVPYQLFSADLARGLLLDARRCAEGQPCPRSYSLRESEGGALAISPEVPDLRFMGASSALRQVIFSTCAALTPQATEVPGGGEGCDPAEPNLYEWDGGDLQLINVLPGEAQGTPGSRLAAQGGAVSTDGARVYFTQLEDGALYLREAGQPTKLLPETLGGAAAFQTASSDGRLAFFIKAGHLFRYVASTEVNTDLTPGGGVLGVLGASADGSRLYYATTAGLFLWNEGIAREVATGAAAADLGDYPPATGTARVSADGNHLAFLSKASLSGYDNTDQRSGLPDVEVFLFDVTANGGTGALTCVSCNPTNERPLGVSTIPGAISNGQGEGATDVYKPRVLSADGSRLFFDSKDAIAPQDASAAGDVYEWEAQGSGTCVQLGGCIFLVSSGKSPDASTFIDASTDGRDALFLSGDSLISSDPGSVDLYDARAGGGFEGPAPVTPCDGDACQSVPSPPEDPTPGTLVSGSPNSKVHFPKRHHKKPPRKKHRGHHGPGKRKGAR